MFNILPGGKPAYLIDAATLIPIFLTIRYWEFSGKNLSLSRLDVAVAVYLFISMCSAIFYLFPENPSDARSYFYGLHHFVLPVFMYYAVKFFDPSRQMRFLRLLCFLNIFAILFGLVMFYYRPGFYYVFLVEKVFSESKVPLEDWQIFGRMQSYFGSTAMGTLASCTLVMLSLLKLRMKLILIIAPIILMGSLLTYQRAGFFTSLIAIIYVIYRTPKSMFLKILFPVIIAIVSVVSVSFYADIEQSILPRLMDKYSWDSVIELFGEKRGYGPGLSYFIDFPLGVGLGGTSSAAELAGLSARGQVVDANFMRILSDIGIIGLFAFFAVLWLTGNSAIDKKQDSLGWIILVGLICIICIGTNTLDSYYISHTFWLFLGIIDSQDPAMIHKNNSALYRS
jgi:hypothetical protein